MTLKKSAFLACLSCLLFVPCGKLHADPSPASSRLEIGPFLSSFAYKEPDLMKESGTMRGLAVAGSWYGRYPAGIDMIRVDALASFGTVDYTSDDSGSMDGVDESMFEARALFGRELSGDRADGVSVFAGLGYRKLADNSSGMVTDMGNIGYDRESNYLYLPLGFGIASGLGKGWTFEGSLEYDYLLEGTQKSEISDASNSSVTYSDDLTNDQESGYGFRVSAKFLKQVSASGTIALEPFYRYWNIDTSSVDYVTVTETGTGSSERQGFVEPKNHSSEFGIAVSYVF